MMDESIHFKDLLNNKIYINNNTSLSLDVYSGEFNILDIHLIGGYIYQITLRTSLFSKPFLDKINIIVPPQEIQKITKILRGIVQKSKEVVYILTARAAYQPIKKYLNDIGINSKKIYVVALASNNPKDKADWIENMIDNEGYDDIYFVDDSEKNVSAAKQMLRTKNVKWRVQHIKH